MQPAGGETNVVLGSDWVQVGRGIVTAKRVRTVQTCVQHEEIHVWRLRGNFAGWVSHSVREELSSCVCLLCEPSAGMSYRVVRQREATSCRVVTQREATSCLVVTQREATSCRVVTQREATSCRVVTQREATSCRVVTQREAHPE